MTAKLKAEIAKEKNIVRRDHLLRVLAGPDAIAHLVEKDTSERDKKLALIDEVSKIGAENKRKAIVAGKKAAANEAKKQEAEAKKRAEEVAKAAEAAEAEAVEVAEIDRLRGENEELRHKLQELEAA